jgi:hypothetical protein
LWLKACRVQPGPLGRPGTPAHKELQELAKPAQPAQPAQLVRRDLLDPLVLLDKESLRVEPLDRFSPRQGPPTTQQDGPLLLVEALK